MKAALYQGKGKIELTRLPDPECLPEGAVLKNVYASICGTDVAVYRHGTGLGHRITVGGEFGHEVCCRIKEVGARVEGLSPGDRVYPYPRLVTGDPAKAGTIGGFSELIGAPLVRDGIEVYRISDKISDRAAALIEPFTVGCRAARRAFPRQGEKVVVFGAGTIGAAAAIALKYFGCSKVLVCDPSEFRCSILRNLGFETCSRNGDELLDAMKKQISESNVDLVIGNDLRDIKNNDHQLLVISKHDANPRKYKKPDNVQSFLVYPLAKNVVDECLKEHNT